jgi:nitroreductase
MDTTSDTAATAPMDALIHAATVAAQAPSIHNTQPWQWRVRHNAADLYADTSRQLHVSDPDRRMLTVSCGVALHHGRVALAAAGVTVDVGLLPTAGDPDHLAHITVTGATAIDPAAEALYDAIAARHTDRRPLLDEALPPATLRELRSSARPFGIGIHPLRGREVAALASATESAQRGSRLDAATRTELDAWASDDQRPPYAGIPIENLPNRRAPTAVPVRDFGHIGTLATTGGHDTAATYAILYGPDDTVDCWLRAGEALSAVWLAATERGIALLPLSDAVEHPTTRGELRRILGGHGYPAIAIRLGRPNLNQPAPPTTPRLPAAATVHVA